MNERQPIPLRPDYGALEHEATRSLVRAITAHALGTLRRTTALRVLSQAWPNDVMAERALAMLTRSATAPLRTADAPALATQAVRMLPRLAPRSAALQLFATAMNVDMSGGVATVRIPDVATVPPARFIAEGERGLANDPPRGMTAVA